MAAASGGAGRNAESCGRGKTTARPPEGSVPEDQGGSVGSLREDDCKASGTREHQSGYRTTQKQCKGHCLKDGRVESAWSLLSPGRLQAKT